jgi:hypothetical protein
MQDHQLVHAVLAVDSVSNLAHTRHKSLTLHYQMGKIVVMLAQIDRQRHYIPKKDNLDHFL